MRGSSLSSFMAILCAIHCVALPVLAGTTTIIDAAAWENPWLEGGLLGFTALVGYATLGPTFRRHRQPQPLSVFTLGLSLMLVAHFWLPEAAAPGATVLGALAVVAAQVLNRRNQPVCCPDHE